MATARFTPYQRRLFVFLGAATFFEGFDQIALTQVLPDLQATFSLDKSGVAWLVAVINIGTVLAYGLVRAADRWGRRPILAITIVGFALLSFASGLATNVYAFAALQLLARIFLIAEWALSLVYAAEEFPPERRGSVVGIISAMGSLGSVFCAAAIPWLVQGPWGWRTVYFVGAVPLLILAFARRSLRETERFVALKNDPSRTLPLFRIWSTPHRKRVLQLALIWGATYSCTQVAVTFWKTFAMGERGFTEKEVAFAISVAAVLAMPLSFVTGKLLDVVGRRMGAVFVFGVTTFGTLGAYLLHSKIHLHIALVAAIYGASAVLIVLNAFTTELFPTEYRADAFAWSNNLLGRLGYVVAPILVGSVAVSTGWGPAVAVTAIGPAIALLLILLLLPETRGRSLEETSTLGH